MKSTNLFLVLGGAVLLAAGCRHAPIPQPAQERMVAKKVVLSATPRDEVSAKLANSVKFKVEAEVVRKGYAVGKEATPDVTVALDVVRTDATKTEIRDWRAFDGEVAVCIRNMKDEGRILAEKSFTAQGLRSRYTAAAEADLANRLSGQVHPWLVSNLGDLVNKEVEQQPAVPCECFWCRWFGWF